MGFVDISVSEKMWEVLYASACLTGEERERVLRELGVPPLVSPGASPERQK